MNCPHCGTEVEGDSGTALINNLMAHLAKERESKLQKSRENRRKTLVASHRKDSLPDTNEGPPESWL